MCVRWYRHMSGTLAGSATRIADLRAALALLASALGDLCQPAAV